MRGCVSGLTVNVQRPTPSVASVRDSYVNVSCCMSNDPVDVDKEPEYLARKAYLDHDTVARYERDRFSGIMGRYRYRREQTAVRGVIQMLPPDLAVLDCPSGVGRWWPTLADRASGITALDVSPAMVAASQERISDVAVPVTTILGVAEGIPMDNGSVDLVFSHALTKHLPVLAQHRVLQEFARVTRKWVISSFSLVQPITYAVWRRRSFKDSYPLLPEQLTDFAKDAGLEIVLRRRCTTPIGVEHTVLFSKSPT